MVSEDPGAVDHAQQCCDPRTLQVETRSLEVVAQQDLLTPGAARLQGTEEAPW